MDFKEREKFLDYLSEKGRYVVISPDRQIGVFYARHMLNNLEPYVHPRIRNLVCAALDD